MKEKDENLGIQPRTTRDDFINVRCVECKKKFRFRSASLDFLEVIHFCSNRCREAYYRKHHRAELEDVMST